MVLKKDYISIIIYFKYLLILLIIDENDLCV